MPWSNTALICPSKPLVVIKLRMALYTRSWACKHFLADTHEFLQGLIVQFFLLVVLSAGIDGCGIGPAEGIAHGAEYAFN